MSVETEGYFQPEQKGTLEKIKDFCIKTLIIAGLIGLTWVALDKVIIPKLNSAIDSI